MRIQSFPKTVFPCCRGTGVSFQKREGPGKGYAERGSEGGRRPSSIHSVEGIPWRFPGGLPPASPMALCRVPGTGFLVFEKRPPYPCTGDAKQRKPGWPTDLCKCKNRCLYGLRAHFKRILDSSDSDLSGIPQSLNDIPFSRIGRRK